MPRYLPLIVLGTVISLFHHPAAMMAQQTGSIQGTVVEAGNLRPLVTVQVSLQGTGFGTLTNQSGEYRLTGVPIGTHQLSVTRLGYGSQVRDVTVEPGETATEDFQLAEAAITLDEFVVTGYQFTRRRERTGSLSQVNREAIEVLNITSPEQALQGRTSGVQVRHASGQPGSGPEIRIRGIGSISAGHDPLYIVDGVQMATDRETGAQASTSPLALLNPEDIESIEVLKDAAATSIYGAQAANGVVLITTRRGASGRTQFTASSEVGIGRQIKTWDVVQASDWVRLQMEAEANRAVDIGQTREWGEQRAIDFFGHPEEVRHFDWQGLILRDAAVRKFNMSASGGTDDTRFFLSGGYDFQEGPVHSSDFDRFSFRANIDHQATERFTLQANVGMSGFNQFGSQTGNCQNCPHWAAPHMRPTINAFNDDGTYNLDIAPVRYNLAIQVFEEERTARTQHGLGNVTANYAIRPRLNFRTLWGLDFRTRRETVYQPPEQQVIGDNSQETYRRVLNWTTNQVLNYETTLGDRHNFSALAGVEYRDESSEVFFARGTGFPSGLFRTLNLAAVPQGIGGFTGGHRIASAFGRVDYDLLGRYLLSGSVRRDGSSRFGADFRYGTFYAVSAGWDLAQESFMDRFAFLNELTMRAGHGITGNSSIDDFASLTLFGTGIPPVTGLTGNTYMGQAGLRPTQLGNDNLTWEQARSTNVGVNWVAMAGRVYGAVDLFRIDNENLLLDRFLPIDAGFGSVTENVGVVRNTGVEIELGAIPLDRSGFRWRSDFNISFLNNEIIELVDGLENIGNTTRVGHPVRVYWGFAWAGVNPADGRPMWYDADGNITYRPTTADQRVIGSQLPDITGGFNNSFSYRGIRLDALLQYVFGLDIQSTQHNNLLNIASTRGLSTEVFNRWRQPGDRTNIPKAYTTTSYPGTSAWTSFSDRYLFDGSYIRLKNVNLSYDLPAGLTAPMRMTQGRVYVRGLNLATWTRFPGLDPEAQEAGATYPNSRQFITGVEFRF
jgi:TonB-dependent starch-binding outer membrane protein SusC